MWDGERYCDQCIDQVDERLREWVKEQPELVEAVPFTATQMAFRTMAFACIPVLGFGILLVFASLCAGRPDAAWSVFALTGLIGLPVILLWTVVTLIMFPIQRPSVSLSQGQLSVRTGRVRASAALSKCRWREGYAREMTAYPAAFLFPGPALILELPVKFIGQAGNRVAVGFTEETACKWRAICRLAELESL